MAIGPQITVNLPTPQAGVQFTALAAAVRQVGELQRQSWVKKASGELVDRDTGAYIAGLRQPDSLRYPFDGDQLTIGVFNVAPHAAPIEYGHGAFNLAQRIRWGQTPASRLSKTGQWYMVIPFRHYTPARAGGGGSPARFRRSMPASVYSLARRLAPGERLTFHPGQIVARTGAITRKAAGGRTQTLAVRGLGPAGGRILEVRAGAPRRAAHQYAREIDIGGGRTVTQHPGHAKSPRSIQAGIEHARVHGGPPPSPFRATSSIFEGMVRTGAAGHTRYMTFRVITPDSQWMIPARAPAMVAKRVAEETGPTIRAMFERAYKADVERAIAGAFRG